MRNSSFEALRIIAILLILLMHVASMAKSIEFNSINYILIGVISSIGNIGVSCFILISGYFEVKLKYDKLLHLIYLTTAYTILIYFSNYFLPAGNIGIKKLVESLFIVPLYKNWFITCYCVTMIISPYINLFLNRLDKKKFQKLLFSLFVCFSLIPTIFNNPYYTILTDGGKCLTYFIFLYFVGRYLKLYADLQRINIQKCILVFSISTISIFLLNTSATYLSHKSVRIYAMDCSPFILCSSISVFFLFKSFQVQSKVINWFSSSVIAVYLLDGSRAFIDYHVFNIDNYANSGFFLAILITEVLFVFILSIFIDKIRIILFSKLENKIIYYFLNHSRNIFKKLYYDVFNPNKHMRQI